MNWEPEFGRGGVWFKYGSGDVPQAGGNLPKIGENSLTVFWGGLPKRETLLQFFRAATEILSRGQAHRGFETQILLPDDEIRLSSMKVPLLPPPFAEKAHFIRFDWPHSLRDDGFPPLAIWTSLDEPEDAIDSVGVYTSLFGISQLRKDLSQFMGTTSSSFGAEQVYSILGDLLRDVEAVNARR